MSEYRPIPVAAAVDLADHFAKSMIVILAYDDEHKLTHVTTYGRTALEKQISAEVGDRCAKLICGDGVQFKQGFEDFRTVDAAERAERIEQLVRACRAARHAIESVLACRTGITDELLIDISATLHEALARAAEKAGAYVR